MPARKRRRRRTTTTPRRRRRRTRSNPRTRANPTRAQVTKRGFNIDLGTPFRRAVPTLAGKLMVAWAVRRWGDAETAPYSPTAGSAWTFKNYLIGALTAGIAGEAIGRFWRKPTGQKVYEGGMDLLMTKLLWTEGVARSPMMQTAFGQTDSNSQIRQLSAQATEGDILDDGKGNRWLMQNGQWVAMMGMGENPYVPQALGAANQNPYMPEPLNGELMEADYLGKYTEDPLGGRLMEAGPLGHQMPMDTPRNYAAASAYLDTGSPDPYHTAYQQ